MGRLIHDDWLLFHRQKNQIDEDQARCSAERSGREDRYFQTAHTKIGLETLVAIANALNTSVDEFLSDTVSNSQVIFNDELKTVLERADMEELKVICKLARVILKKD